jgi:uncharacterized protein
MSDEFFGIGQLFFMVSSLACPDFYRESLTCTVYLYGANKITMYTLDEIKSILAKAKPELQKKYPLSELGVFGSYARGDANEDSDIDVLVDFNGRIGGMNYIGLAHEIAALFKTKVDVVSKGGIKSKYFKFVSEDLIYV